MSTYNQIRIRKFLADRIDLRDFCFVLENELNSEYAYQNIPGTTPREKSINLVKIADRLGESGELVLHLAWYWISDIHGSPRVLIEEGIHEELVRHYQELLQRDEQKQAEQVLFMIKKVVPERLLNDLLKETPDKSDETVLKLKPEATPPEPGSEYTIPEPVQLTLRFSPQGDTAKVTWEADVIGQKVSDFSSPYDAATLPTVIKALDAVQWPGYPKNGPQFNQAEQKQLIVHKLWAEDRVVEDVDRQVGRELYNAMTVDTEGNIALQTVRNHAIAQGATLTYLLRFPDNATELAAHPWELLWNKHGAILLSHHRLASCVRYLDLDQALPPSAPSGSTLRILAIAPRAGIHESIRTAERQARTDAWNDLIQAGIVEMEELSPATRKALVDRIQTGPPVDIIHFYGHGCYKDGQGFLIFDKSDGDHTWVRADQLATLLGGTKLIMLHACQSAMISDTGLVSGVAPALIAAGVPAVVAMQLTVRVKSATRFAGIVYRFLARGESLQHAVNLARQALYFETTDRANWYVPTLTIRARDTGPFYLVKPH